MTDAPKGRYQVLVGTVGTLTKEGRPLRHRLGELIDVADDEAERLLGIGAVADTRSKEAGKPAPAGTGPQPSPSPSNPPPAAA